MSRHSVRRPLPAVALNLVLLFHKAVPFIVEYDVLDRDVVLLDRGDHLIRVAATPPNFAVARLFTSFTASSSE